MTKKIFLQVSGVVVAAVLAHSVFTGIAAADSYNVNASVPYEAPSQAAVIEQPADGSTFENVQQAITGTCQVQNPAAVVSIWREGTVLGSSECTSGRFNIPVILLIGQNDLIVKTANASGIYGPDSLKKTIHVKYPPSVEPLPPTVNQPTTTEARDKAINQGGVSGLSLTTETPYEILASSKQVTLRIIVNGGKQPYVLQIKWGDGSTESHSLDQAGTYDFMHTYLTHKNYTVYAYVRDVLGAYTEYVYAVVSGQQSATSTGGTENTDSDKPSGTQWRLAGIVWYYWLILIFVLGILLSSYILGYRRGQERSKEELEKRQLSSKKKQKRAKP